MTGEIRNPSGQLLGPAMLTYYILSIIFTADMENQYVGCTVYLKKEQ